MGSRITPLPGGLLIPDRATRATLAPVGAGLTDSSYTEASPRPGFAVADDAFSRLRIEVSGTQGEDADVRVVKAGSPARDGAQVAFKTSAEGAASWRGWDAPCVVNGWTPLDYVNGATALQNRRFAVTVIPSNQHVIVAWPASVLIPTNTVSAASVSVDRVATVHAAARPPGDSWNWPALVTLPGSERVILFYGGAAYYSDDEGATWATWSEALTEEDTTDYGRSVAAHYRGDVIVLVEDSAVAGTVYQLASSDLGASFQLVGTYAALGTGIGLASSEEGIHVCWTTATGDATHRLLGSAFDPLDAATGTVVAAGVADSTAIVSDGGGTVYLLYTDAQTARMYSSVDGGVAWTSWRGTPFTFGAAPAAITSPLMAWAAGSVALLCNASGVYSGDSVAIVWLGGWTSAPLIGGSGAQPWERWGWARHLAIGAAAGDGQTWVPFSRPHLTGWTWTGTFGTLTGTSDLLINTAAATGYGDSPAQVGRAGHVALVELYLTAGGSLATSDVMLGGELADGTTDYEWALHFAAGGYRIRDDNAGTTLADVSVSLSALLQVMVEASTSGTIAVYHRRPGETVWTAAYSGTLAADTVTPSASGGIRFGHETASTATSRWRQVHWCSSSETTIKPAISASIASHVGKPLNSRPEPVPVLGASPDVAWLAITAGPARRDDGFTIAAYRDYSIDHVHCHISPSPARAWRSTDTTEQAGVYDLGADSWMGHSVGLFVTGANFKAIALEYFDPVGGAWVSIGTLDLSVGFAGLTYTLTGETMHPDTGATAEAGRWLWEQERAGAWVYTAAGSSRIEAQTAGAWSQSTSVRPMLRLETPGALAASGTCDLVASDGVLIVHPAADLFARRWRWRIPAGSAGVDTPDGESYYEAGSIQIARVQAFGAAIGWGRIEEHAPNVEEATDEWGTMRIRERGPLAGDWTIAWPDPANLRALRAQVAADYVGPAAGVPNAGAEDIHRQLVGLVELTRSGEIPVVGIEPIPDPGESITDPARFRYGRLVGSVRATQIAGDELGVDEVLRVDSLRLVELV